MLLPVLVISVPHSIDDGPELSTHAARMLAIVSSRSRPSQLTGAPAPVQLAAVAPWLLQKLAGAPVEMLARLACAWLTALASPILLVDDVPMFCPLGLAELRQRPLCRHRGQFVDGHGGRQTQTVAGS